MAEIKQTGSLDLRSAKAAKDTAIENSDAINLTPWFSYGPLTTENTGKYWSSASNHYQVLDDGWGRFDEENTSSSDVNKDIAILPQDVFELGQEYTFLLEWHNVIATGSTNFYFANDPNHYQFVQSDENPGVQINSTTNSSGSDRRFIVCTLSASDPNATRAIYWRAKVHANSSIFGEFRLSVYKGRYYGGYKPYVDQSLINGYFNLNNEIDNVRSNATSFCPTSFDTKDPAKWYQVSWMISDFTKLDDGWYHLETDNTAGSSAASRYIAPRNWDLIEPGETYTILFEIRNFSGPPNTSTSGIGYIQEMAGAQFWGNSTVDTIGRPNHTNKATYFYANDISDDGNLTFRMFKVADSTHLGDTQQYNGMCFRYRLYALAGYVTSYDFRISIYPGKYYGGYTPYLINSTYYKILEVEDNAAPKATAIKRTQRIYYRSNSSTKPTTPGNATANWVTQTGNNVDATWTTAHLPISDTHKYIYTCEQSETNAGVVSYTTVLLDDTITVIDGGKLITGSVKTNSIDAESGTFNTANIPVLTADHIKANVISAVNQGTGRIEADKIDVSSISIGSLSGSESLAHKNLIPQPSYFSNVTDVGDGWIHVEYSNSSTSPASHYWNLHHCDDVEPGKTYTIMLEFRNWTCTTNPTGNYMYLQQVGTYQFWGSNGIRSDGKEEAREQYATYVHYEDVIDGSMCAHIVKEADTDHEPSPTANLLRYQMYTPAQSEMEFDIRWSLYEGDYSGPYNAYIDQSLSSRLSTAEDTIDGHTSSIATIGTKADNALTNASTAVETANNAAKTATNYVTAIDGKGIWLTPSNEKPDSSGDEIVGTTTGWHISNALDLFRKGISMFKVWVDETTNAVLTRIGGTNTGHLLLEQSAIKLCDATGWVGKFDLTTTETAEGFDPIHTVALEVNDGTEQGAHLGLNISHNGTTDRHFVKLGSSSYGVGVDSSGLVGVNASSVSIGPAASMGDDKTFSIDDILHAFGKVLFTGSYSTTKSSTVTLLESAENFYMLRIICEDSSGQHISTDIYEPNNKSFSVTFSVAIPDALYIKSKSYRISGTSISCVQATASGNSYYRHGEAILRASGVTYTTNEVIGIVRVIGFY